MFKKTIKAEKIIENPHDLAETETNGLVLEMFSEKYTFLPENTNLVISALIQLGAYRTEGVSFSADVSNIISEWILEIYVIQSDNVKGHIVDLVVELESRVAIGLVKKLLPLTKNEYLKESLYDAVSYAGT